MATTPYEVINGIFLDNRSYMIVINFYTDWSYFNKVTDETASTEDIERFIKDIKNLTDKDTDTIRASLFKYFSYLDKENIVKIK